MRNRQQYRACLVDAQLNQVTFWEWLNDDGRCFWPDGLVAEPVRVNHYLIHDTITDQISIGRLDVSMRVTKHNTMDLSIDMSSKWGKPREVSPY